MPRSPTLRVGALLLQLLLLLVWGSGAAWCPMTPDGAGAVPGDGAAAVVAAHHGGAHPADAHHADAHHADAHHGHAAAALPSGDAAPHGADGGAAPDCGLMAVCSAAALAPTVAAAPAPPLVAAARLVRLDAAAPSSALLLPETPPPRG